MPHKRSEAERAPYSYRKKRGNLVNASTSSPSASSARRASPALTAAQAPARVELFDDGAHRPRRGRQGPPLRDELAARVVD